MVGHPRANDLSACYDGELGAGAAARIEEHLLSCEGCRRDYRDMARLANTVRHLPRLGAPVNLADAIRGRVDAEERGMVPVLREQIRHSSDHSGWFPALGLGTVAFVALALVALALLFDRYGEDATRRLSSALIQTTLPEPVLLLDPISSPRFRGGSVSSLPFAEVERGKEGTILTLASIDRNGAVRALEVMYQSGDEAMLSRTLEVVRGSGFEPARLGGQTISVNFLYLFTTTEVRSGDPLTTQHAPAQRLGAAV